MKVQKEDQWFLIFPSLYWSIKIFAGNFDEIHNQLEKFSTMGTGSERQAAHQLLCASSSSTFLFSTFFNIISYYSALLEPVTQVLQAVQLDLLQVQEYIDKLLHVISEHRSEAEEHFRMNVFGKVTLLAQKLDIVEDRLIETICKYVRL